MTKLQYDVCPEISKVENGQFECTNFNIFGSECRIKCDVGFKYSGDQEISVYICAENGAWFETGEPGVCEPISCPAITEPENGKVKCEGIGSDTVCIISCISGYYLDSGPESDDQLYSVHCQSDEKWDRPVTGLRHG